jgi:uncharacterized membrane protein
MKRISWKLRAVMGAVIWTTGCNNGTPGGPGAEADKDKNQKSTLQKAEDLVIQPEGTYSLTLPLLETPLKQGERKEVSIGIRRGKNFDEDVAIKFEDVPEGVTVDPTTTAIKHDQKETKVFLKAGDDAAVGKFAIKVTGHADKGPDASNKLNVLVDKK